MTLDDPALCDRFAELYTGAVSDALDDHGRPDQCLPPAVTPLDGEMRFAGVAYPAVGEPDPDGDAEANLRRILRMLGTVPAHSALVIQSNGAGSAQLGELMTTALTARDCRGAVVDGGIRDTRFIREQEFPVANRFRTPRDSPPRWRLTDWDVSVTVGEVEIAPGDIVVGDADGVVCVPRDLAEAVLTTAEDTATTEDRIREAVRDGTDPVTAFERYGTF